jgi:DNA-binding response OmpR family regulator
MLLRGARVLVVEAERRALWSVMGPLIQEGAHVDGATSGREAFMLSRRRPFDVVITALELPDTSADVLLRAVRAVSSPAPVVVVTGADQRQSGRAREVGADRFFATPTDGRAVVAYLQNRELARAA